MSDTELDTYAKITVHYEPRNAPDLGPHACVNLDVKGNNRKVTFLMPVGPVPQHVSLATCDRWVEIVQGPVISGCAIDDDQRDVLLHLFLAYRAFVRGLPGTKSDDWYRFASELVILANSAGKHECVDDHLRETLEWIHDALPVNIFLDPSIPPIVYNDAPPPAELEHIVVETVGISREQQVALRKHHEATIYRLAFAALRTVPEGAPPEVFAPILLQFAGEEDSRRAQLAGPHAASAANTNSLMDAPIPASLFDEVTPGRLYITVELPLYLVGSVHTSLVDLVMQCSLHKVEPDGRTTVLPMVATYPIPLLAGPGIASPSPVASVACTAFVPPMSSSVLMALASSAAPIPPVSSAAPVPPISSAALAALALSSVPVPPVSTFSPIAPIALTAPAAEATSLTPSVLTAPLALGEDPVMPPTPPTAPSTPPTVPSASLTHRFVPRRLTVARLDRESFVQHPGPPLLGTPRATSSPRAPGPRARAALSSTPARRTARARDVEAAIAQRREATRARHERQREERAARAASRVAIRASVRAVGEDAGDSDDSMPSLRTVTDSSDGSVSEFDLAYPGDE